MIWLLKWEWVSRQAGEFWTLDDEPNRMLMQQLILEISLFLFFGEGHGGIEKCVFECSSVDVSDMIQKNLQGD